MTVVMVVIVMMPMANTDHDLALRGRNCANHRNYRDHSKQHLL